MNGDDNVGTSQLPAHFRYRVNTYWQSLSVYAVTLIVYAVIRALWDTTLQQDGLVSIVLTDPVVVLLSAFVLWSAAALIFNSIADRRIAVGETGITFTSKFHERTFVGAEIERISVGRDKRIKVRGVFSVIKMRVKNRRRTLRIRPALYHDEHALVEAIIAFRSRMKVSS